MKGRKEQKRSGFATVIARRAPWSCQETGMTSEGLPSSPGVSTSEKKTAGREAADRFTGRGSHGCADPRGGMPGAPRPTHSCLSVSRQACTTLSFPTDRLPEFPSKNPASPYSQMRGTLPADDSLLVSPPGFPLVRCRCPVQLKSPWVLGAVNHIVR